MSATSTTQDQHHPTATLPSPNPSKSFWHVEPSPLLLGHRSTRNLPETADIVVVGSGITGASVAWHLLQQRKQQNKGDDGDDGDDGDEGKKEGGDGGLSIVMLEAREACWGATGRNGGHCQPILFEHPSDPAIGHFELQNLSTIRSLCDTLDIDCEFHIQQGVRAVYSTTDLEKSIAAIKILQQTDAALAAHVRIVTDPLELGELRIPTAVGAVVTDVAARLWPYKFVSHILETLLTSASLPGNGKFNLQTYTPVTNLQEPSTSGGGGDSWTVTTPRGAITTTKVILATNAYTSHLLPSYADLIVPVRGQMSALVPPPSLSSSNRLTTSFGMIGPAQDDYLIQRDSVPRGGGSEQLLFGGGRSSAPSLGVCNDEVVDPETAKYLRGALFSLLLDGEEEEKTKKNKNKKAEAGVEGEGGRRREMEASHEWTGIMGFSRDSRPFVGQVPGKRGVFLAAGYTGHGMPNAWLCGRAAAAMVEAAMGGRGNSDAEIVEAAVEGAGLPRSYVLDEERMVAARRRWETVAAQDRLSGFEDGYVV